MQYILSFYLCVCVFFCLFSPAYVCKIRMEVLRKNSFLPTASKVFFKHLSHRWITHFKVILKSVRGKLPTINCTKRQKCLFILVLFNIVSLWGSKVLMPDNFSLWQNCFFHYPCAEFCCSPCSRGTGLGTNIILLVSLLSLAFHMYTPITSSDKKAFERFEMLTGSCWCLETCCLSHRAQS